MERLAESALKHLARTQPSFRFRGPYAANLTKEPSLKKRARMVNLYEDFRAKPKSPNHIRYERSLLYEADVLFDELFEPGMDEGEVESLIRRIRELVDLSLEITEAMEVYNQQMNLFQDPDHLRDYVDLVTLIAKYRNV